jgi:hypothetical protein
MEQNIEYVSLSDGWKAAIYREWDFPSNVVEAWERLSGDSGDTGIFTSYAWFSNWWSAFGKTGELFVVVIMKDSEPKGIFPCRLNASSTVDPQKTGICSLTNDHSCHYDFIVDADDRHIILSEFVKLILLKSPKTQMYFDCLRIGSPNIQLLSELLSDARIPFHQYRQKWAPWMEIESNMML